MIRIVFDLEMTCWEDFKPVDYPETIEIGGVKIDDYGESIGTFDHLVKPLTMPTISRYCYNLTGITQKDINNASGFSEVIQKFYEWAYAETDDVIFLSWGKKDLQQINFECELYKVENEISTYFDLKEQYFRFRNLSKKIGLVKAMKSERLDFEGKPHRALVDSLNLSRLYLKYFDEWIF